MATASAHEMLTPLSSVTSNAPFVIEESRIDVLSTSGTHPVTSGGALHKLRTKTSLQDIPEGRDLRADSNQSTQSHAPGQWNTRFVSCASGRDVALVACCPCFPAARLHSLLGGSFESGMVFFGGLVFGMLLLLGLSNSNVGGSSSSSTGDGAGTRSDQPTTSGADKFVAQDADPLAAAAASSHNALLYAQCAAALLVVFLLGVAYLRTKTRRRFNIPGSRALDCVLSVACCWCVLTQARTHTEKRTRFEIGLDTPIDTLPAYS